MNKLNFPYILKFLPLVFFVVLLSFSVRIGNLWYDVEEGSSITMRPQTAEATEKQNSDPLPLKGLKSFDETEMLILQHLSERRDELDKKEKEIEKRQADLLTLEKRLTIQKQEVENALQQLENQGGALNTTANDNVSKIYARMNPKEAARILETLDSNFCTNVLRALPPLQSAAILGKMEHTKAQELTLKLNTFE